MSNDKTRAELKGYFKKHAIPTEGQFADFIESTLNLADDGIGKQSDGTLTLQVTSTDDHNRLLYLAKKGEQPTWTLSLNPLSDPTKPETARSGFSINDTDDNSRVFVDHDTGRVGIGTVEPGERLEVDGNIKADALTIGAWPHSPAEYVFFGTNALDQATDANYALLQDSTGAGMGRTYLNSPVDIRVRVGNVDKMVVLKSGNVGIGTPAPADLLDVNGDIRVRGADIKDAGGTSRIKLVDNGDLDFFDAGGTSRITISDNGRLDLKEDGGAIALSIDKASMVGIGIASPLDTLDVNGDIRVRGGDIKDAAGTPRITIANNGRLDLRNAEAVEAISIDKAGSVGIGTTGPQGILHLVRYGNDSKQLVIGNSNQPNSEWFIRVDNSANLSVNREGLSSAPLYIRNNGNVGIAKIPTTGKLEVAGTVKATAFSGDGSALTGVSAGNWSGSTLKMNDNKGIFWGGTSVAVYGSQVNGYLKLKAASADAVTINSSGNVGIKTSPSYTLHTNGTSYAKVRKGGGIDYAEYFESLNGKTVPTGTSVVLAKGKIMPAKKGDIPIGVISANPIIAGGIHAEWPKRHLRDELGNLIMEEYQKEIMVPKKEKIRKERQRIQKSTIEEEVSRTEIILENDKYCQKEFTETVTREIEEPVFEEVDRYDAKGETVIGRHQVAVMEAFEEEIEVTDERGDPVLAGSGSFVTEQRPKKNPDYDESREYIGRESRPEWNCVGLLGQLALRKGQPVAPSWTKIRDVSDKVELWLVK